MDALRAIKTDLKDKRVEETAEHGIFQCLRFNIKKREVISLSGAAFVSKTDKVKIK